MKNTFKLSQLAQLSLVALLAGLGVGAHAQTKNTMHAREGLSVSAGVEQWKWVEYNEDGSEFLNEQGGPVANLGASYTFSTHQDRVFHTVSVKSSLGDITYNGSYMGGGAVTSTTKYNVFRLGYDVAAPLFDSKSVEWTAGLAYEQRNRQIWNPSLKASQVEDYASGIARVGVQVPRPVQTGWFGAAGLTATLFTNMDPHATALGFKASPVLRPKADTGFYAKAGYAFTPNLSIELSHEVTRLKISQKAGVETTGGAVGQIWQPASSLGRTSLQAVYKF